MSRKFMVLMLVVFGVLLYLTSYALHKQTEPPPPPPAEDAQKMKEAQEAEYRQRYKSMQDKKGLEKDSKAKLAPADDLKTPPGKGVGAAGKLPLPPQEKKSPGRKPTDMVITENWTKLHADGTKGIDQEIAERAKHAEPSKAKMKLAPTVNGQSQ